MFNKSKRKNDIRNCRAWAPRVMLWQGICRVRRGSPLFWMKTKKRFVSFENIRKNAFVIKNLDKKSLAENREFKIVMLLLSLHQ